MRKVFVSVNDCKPGVRIAENIFNEYGAILVVENTVLDEHMLSKIKDLGLVKIKVFDYNEDMIIVSGTELFKAQYNENLNTVKNMLNDISCGKTVDYDTINHATDSIINRINENRDIVTCINDMREVDDYLYTHSINVALLVMLIGKWLKYDYYHIKSLVTAGFLHDIGKCKIPAEILNKPGTLNEDEFNEMKKHSQYSLHIAEKIPNLNQDIFKGILMHHEREDGSGYPFGLKGDQIHEFAKIIAVADIFDAMTSNRAYKKMECAFDVIERMEKENFGKLDHKVLNTFMKNIASYYMGDFVKLSTGDIGEVVYINPFNVAKPIIKVDEVYIDLSREKSVKILELI